MNHVFFAIAAVLVFAACQNEEKKPDANNSGVPTTHVSGTSADPSAFTTIEWIDSINQNFSGIKEGSIVEVSYRFKNSGTRPLVIQNVAASCGCTVPEKPEKPIAPGEESVIKGKFDSKGRAGTNAKTLKVTTNTANSPIMLSFTVDVEPGK